MSENEELLETPAPDGEPKDMVWLIGYMRDLIANEIESEVQEILQNEPNQKKISLKLRSKIEGLRRAAEIARERA